MGGGAFTVLIVLRSYPLSDPVCQGQRTCVHKSPCGFWTDAVEAASSGTEECGTLVLINLPEPLQPPRSICSCDS